MSRPEQVNQLLHEELSVLVNSELEMPNGLVTINFVDCSPDLRNAKIGISVLPENITGTALEKLRKKNSLFSNILRKKTRLRTIPKFIWVIDNTAKNMVEAEAEIDRLLAEDKSEER